VRIVTRPDFDGVVCATLIRAVEPIDQPIKWAAPNDMQKGRVAITGDDIVANLPYHPDCALWFDHHYTNRTDHPFEGLFRIAPSAAGLVYEYYRDRLKRDYTELIKATDKIDSADLNLDEILNPQNYPYIILSMTVFSNEPSEEPYWNSLVEMVGDRDIHAVLANPEVLHRTEQVIRNNQEYQALLSKHTIMQGPVSITDFRDLDKMPDGNRFLIYSMFPESTVNVKIGFEDPSHARVVVKVGHSILNRNCRVNVGHLLSQFGGGGHRGAGACRFDLAKADDFIPKIVNTLVENKPNA
jgi:nanoRNase/pAp phosphatase (c-di-AMP/oligoRNAs hydrolase)